MDTSTFIGPLVLGLIALGTLLNIGLQIAQRSSAQRQVIEPQPLEVCHSPEYALAAELERVEKDLSKRIQAVDVDLKKLRAEIVHNGEVRRQSIEAKVEAVRHELAADIKGVHERVDKVLSAVSELKGRVDTHE